MKTNTISKFIQKQLFIGVLIISIISQFTMSAFAEEIGDIPETSYHIKSYNVSSPSFDPRMYSLVTSVKDQKNTKWCVVYSTLSCAESNAIFQRLETNTVDFSEIYYDYRYNNYRHNEKKVTNIRVQNPEQFDEFNEDTSPYALAYESDFPMDYSLPENYTLTDAQYQNYKYKISRVYHMEFYDNTETDKNTIKFMILNYGSTMAGVNSIALNCYYQYATKAIVNYQDITAYCDTDYTTDHAVQIVGWNDNYPKENFKITPPANGAWLIKNSWGAGQDNGFGSGYIWLSYYDKTLCDITALSVVPKDQKVYTEKTFTAHYGDVIDFQDEVPDTITYLTNNPMTKGSYTKTTGSSSAKCTFQTPTKTYYTYDAFDNLVGVFTVNVKAKDNKLTSNFTDSTFETEANQFQLLKSDWVYAYLDGVNVPATFTSSNPDVATFNKDSTYLQLKGFGTTTITATYQDKVVTDDKPVTCQFTVTINEIPDTTTEATNVPSTETYPTGTTETNPVVVPNNTTTVVPNTTEALPNNTTVTKKTPNIYTPYQTPVKPIFKCVGVKNHISYRAEGKTATVVGIKGKVKNITIPKTVRLYGHTFTVTGIKAKAFQGKDIQKITIKSTKITSFGKNSFQVKNKKKCQIILPKSCKKSYFKKIVKSTKGLLLK